MGRAGTFFRRFAETGPAGLPERVLLAVLEPLGWVYGAVMRGRAFCYRRGILPSYRAPVPVISIGNLSVGGTGKTPTVDFLVNHLRRRGIRVAVVSRGYGGKAGSQPVVVSAGNGPQVAPELCGDEPYLLSRRNPGCLVFVASRRADGVRLAVEEHGAEAVILDDGFQHLAVARDLDIVLLDASCPLGNGRVLPAGLLREFPAALQRADLLVLTRSRNDEQIALPVRKTLVRCRHILADSAVDLSGQEVLLSGLRGRRGVAFAGIADPAAFFAALEENGLQLVKKISFSDHIGYDAGTLEGVRSAAAGADFLVTTEKDGVKLGSGDFAIPCYQVPLTLQFTDRGTLLRAVDDVVDAAKGPT